MFCLASRPLPLPIPSWLLLGQGNGGPIDRVFLNIVTGIDVFDVNLLRLGLQILVGIYIPILHPLNPVNATVPFSKCLVNRLRSS